MKQLNVKKLVLLNLPYILLGLFATNLGEAWRLAAGADASAKMLSFFSTLPVALGSWWPSLHPLDLAVGLCCGAALRLAVYLKGKADFVAKLQIALKECSESEYWLELLLESGYYEDHAVLQHCTEVKRLLIASINTAKRNMT